MQSTLSPIEHLFTGAGAYPITMSFSYHQRLPIDALRAGLTAAVRELPWASSRLRAVDECTWGLSVEPDLVTLESSDASLVSVATREGEPVARLTLSGDGRRLSASISHAVVDGFSYFQFLTSWARLTRGDRVLSATREELTAIAYQGVVTPASLLAQSGVVWDEPRASSSSVREVRQHIPSDELRAQREQADGMRLFDNDLIAARLWKEHGRHHDGVSQLSLPIDLRPPLRARRHFGCAVGFAVVSLPADQVQTASVVDLALEVRTAVARFDKTAAARALGILERLRRQEGRAVMEQLHVRHPRAGLIVTNLTRMPVRDLDFGSGPPCHVAARSETEFSAALFAGEDGVDAQVYLPAR